MEYRHILVALEMSDDSKILIDRAAFFPHRPDKPRNGTSFVYIRPVLTEKFRTR